jgi:osmotically inducible protein OsmC
MPEQTVYAEWEGKLKGGQGTVKSESNSFDLDYNFAQRFTGEPGANPEELLAAAHASCYSMALAKALEDEGYPPEKIVTAENIQIEETDNGFEISKIILHTQVVAQGLNNNRFQELATATKDECPVSKALQGIELELKAILKDV